MLVAPVPGLLARRQLRGLQITEATQDPSGGAFTVQYGNCLQGGQGTCTPPLRIVTTPDNSFLPGGQTPAAPAVVRGVPRAADRSAGRTISIPTGGVVVDIFAKDAATARARPRAIVAINRPGSPGEALPRAAPRHGLRLDAAAVAAARRRRARSARGSATRGVGSTGRTAIVMRVTAQTRSSSSLKVTSQTHVVRPAVQAHAARVHVPSVTGRRKLVLFDSPIAISPCAATATCVASDASDSAIEA